MQRHRHNQKFSSTKKRLQIFNCFRQHASQNIRCRSNLVVFEQMNQFTQAAFVAPVGCSLDVRRFETAAQSTPTLAGLMLRRVILRQRMRMGLSGVRHRWNKARL